MRHALYSLILLFVLLTVFSSKTVLGESEQVQWQLSGSSQLLVLNAYQVGLPVPDTIDKGIITELRTANVGVANVFVEKLDLARFPGREHRARIVDMLRSKFPRKSLKVVILEGYPAVEFAAEEGADLFPDDALLITLTTPSVKPLDKLPNKVVNIPWRVDPEGTLSAALEIFPKTRRVIVVTSTHDYIMPFLDETRKALSPWNDKLEIQYTNDIPYEEMLTLIANAPQDTVIIYAPYFNDTTGRSFVPAEVAETLAQKANSPIFTIMDSYIGFGFVGGRLQKTEHIGETAARTALEYLSGNLQPTQTVTTLETTTSTMFDWSALERWRGELSHLPADSVVINRPQSLWDEHRQSIVAIAAVFLTLMGTVIVTARQNRLRARAEMTARQGEARLRVLIDQAPDAIVVYHADQDRFIDANPKAETLFGCNLEELLGSRLARFYPAAPEEARIVTGRMQEYLAAATTGQSLQFELKLRQASGNELLSEVRLIRLPSRENRLYRFSFVDITERKQAEQALADGATRRKVLIEQSRDGIVVIDQEGKVYEANQMFARMLGYTSEEILALHVWDWDTQLTQKQILDMLQSVDDRGDFFESRHRRKDGTLVEVEISSNGAICGGQKLIFCVCRDISTRKQAEAALRESERRFRQLFEVTAFPLCFVTRDSVIADMNTSFTQVLGYTKKDIATLAEWWPRAYPDPDYRRWVIATWDAAVQRAIENESAIDPIEYQVTCKNGDIRTMVISGTIIDNDFLATFFDITERKWAEEERERLMAAIKQTSDIIVITDHQGNIEFVNQAFETITGYSRDEVIGKNPRIFNSGQQSDAFYDELWATISRGKTWRGCLVNRHRNGTLFTEEATISPVRDAMGKIVNYVASKRDITDHLRLENQLQQAQKMESVGRLAGGIAHDFNNMLGVILGYTEMALDAAEPGTQHYAHFKEIYDTALRSADLTRQLLAFARQQTIAPKPLDLNETIEGMLKMLRRLIGENIELVWKPGSSIWLVNMDPSQIDQVLVNLCVNARDAITDIGTLTIETTNMSLDDDYCATREGAVAGEYVMMAVSDDGCGMDSETKELVFEPFFTTKEMGKGTGLGLSTVYGIVKQNKGSVAVYSEPGRGTTFKIYIPRYTDGTIAEHVETPAKLEQGSGGTVLLVEDEPAMLKMVRILLEKRGYKVVCAATPSEALNLIEEYPGEIHLLMTDVVMPEMNGQELAEKLLMTKPEMQCLFMSGYTADVIAHQGVLKEGVHFISKPFSSKELAAKVGGMLGSRTLQDAEHSQPQATH